MTTTQATIESDLDLLAALVRDGRKARREGREPAWKITHRAAREIEDASQSVRTGPNWGRVSCDRYPDGSERFTVEAGAHRYTLMVPGDGSRPVLDLARD